MESHINTLRTYISTQRQNGVADESIYRSLVSSGWPADLVTQAFSVQTVPSVTHPVIPVNQPAAALADVAIEPSNEKGLYAGRLNRLGFLMAHVYILIYFAVALTTAMLGRGSAIVNSIVFLLAGIGVLIAMVLPFFFYARRWHDINQSGWLALLLLIPGAALPLVIILLIVPGTKGPNHFGTASQKTISPFDVYGLGK